MELKEKLLLIQNELKAPKSQINNFGKYKYRNCEDILEAVKPICATYKATLVLSDDVVQVGERFYLRANAILYDIGSDKELKVTAYAREEESKKGMDGSQVTGAASSYARKYALNGLFNIDDTKDADTTNIDENETKETKKTKEPEKSKGEIKTAKAIDRIGLIENLLKAGSTIEKACKFFDKRQNELTDEMILKFTDGALGNLNIHQLEEYRDSLTN